MLRSRKFHFFHLFEKYDSECPYRIERLLRVDIFHSAQSLPGHGAVPAFFAPRLLQPHMNFPSQITTKPCNGKLALALFKEVP